MFVVSLAIVVYTIFWHFQFQNRKCLERCLCEYLLLWNMYDCLLFSFATRFNLILSLFIKVHLCTAACLIANYFPLNFMANLDDNCCSTWLIFNLPILCLRHFYLGQPTCCCYSSKSLSESSEAREWDNAESIDATVKYSCPPWKAMKDKHLAKMTYNPPVHWHLPDRPFFSLLLSRWETRYPL